VTWAYGSVLLFVGIGMVLTMLIQSSSASIALTLVLCENGTIGYEMAAALVLGENIGTTITRICCIGRERMGEANGTGPLRLQCDRRVWALFLFHPYLRGLDQLVSEVFHSSPFTDPAAVKWALTFLHISFNTITTLLLIGFIPFIERIVTWMVPTKTDDDEVYRLDYLDSDIPLTPEVSLMEARKEISRFGRITNDMLGMVRELLTVKDNKQREHLMAQLAKYEQITDRLEIEVGKYLTKTSTEVRSEEASSRIQGLLAITGDLERVGDIFFQMSKSIERKVYDRLWFSPEQRQQLMEMMDLLERAFTVMRRNMEVDQDQVALDEAVEAEQRINQKRDLLRRTHLKSMESGDYNVKSGLIYNDLFSSCEKVGDHLINVSEALAGEV
jgi:phosphate:Na+ symporter